MAFGLSLGLGLGARSGTSLAAQVAALFGPSDVGVYLDPSDLTTIYQDAAGTTPVTAAGQAVRLQLDKSKGLVRGAERIPAASGWTRSANWTVDVGASRATLTNATNSGDSLTLSSAFDGLAIGRVYELTITVESVTGSVLFGGSRLSLWSAPVISIPGTYRFLLGCNLTGAGSLRVSPSGAGVSAVVSGLSIREIPGNHAYQATALSRPTFQTGPARLTDDGGDSLNAIFPAGNYTVIYAGSTGDPVVLTSQAYSGATDVLLSAAQVGYFAINRALSASEEAKVVAWLRSKQT